MITFKRFSASERLSQETLAFAADVYWAGRKIGHASNEGRGGEAGFWRCEKADAADLAAAEGYARQQQLDIGTKEAPRLVNAARLEEYLDWLACDLMNIKRERSWLRRGLGRWILFYHGGRLLSIKQTWNPCFKDKVVRAHPGAQILNEMSFEEAFRLHAAKHGLRAELI